MKPSLILHPVSFSASGRAALANAVALARWYQADLHVLELRGRQVPAQNPIVRSIGGADVEPHFAEFVQSVGCADVRVSAVELHGDVVEAVVDYADRASADLVVVASHARSHGPYWRSGAYANDLARAISCPTLAVSATAEFVGTAPFTHILCPADSSHESITAVQAALQIAQQVGAQLTVLHVQESPGHSASSLETRFGAEDIVSRIQGAIPTETLDRVDSDTIVVSGVADRAIAQKAAEIGADLIVVARPPRDSIDRVAMNSTAASLLRRARCSVLVVPSAGGDPILLAPHTVGFALEPVFSR